MVIQMELSENQKQQEKEKEQNQLKQIEQWTGLKCLETLFDSDKDNWKMRTSVFSKCVKGKKQIVFIIEDTEGEKFGFFMNSEISKEEEDF